METTQHARALYEDAAEVTDGKAMGTLAEELEKRADQVRQGQIKEDLQQGTGEVRSEVADVLADTPPEEREAVADQLEDTAALLKKVFGNAAPTAKKLPGDTAAQARLQSTEMQVDPLKLAQGEGEVVDEVIATDLRNHELEHNHQSTEADAEEVTIGTDTWDAGEVREIAAVSVQRRIDFLSTKYRGYAKVKMNDQHRSLVRQGRFRELEAAMNGTEALAA